MENDKKTLAAFVCKKAADEALSATLCASELLFAAIHEGDWQTAEAIMRAVKDVRERAANLNSVATVMIEHPEREDSEQNAFYQLNRTIESSRCMMQTVMNSPQRTLRKRYEEMIKSVKKSYESVTMAPRTLDDVAFNSWDGMYAEKVRAFYESLATEDEE